MARQAGWVPSQPCAAVRMSTVPLSLLEAAGNPFGSTVRITLPKAVILSWKVRVAPLDTPKYKSPLVCTRPWKSRLGLL